uniref:Pentatricopeptide repeat-containing protein n=1 Tax=Kalanchoe fedtschenkoi TaxID=63787 RepID=A0A7N0SW23_KALFE
MMVMTAKVSTLSSRLRALTTMSQLQQTQAQVIKLGLETDPLILSALLTAATRSPSGCLTHAQSIFSSASTDNVYHCNIMIRAYASSLFPLRGLHVYNRMRRREVRHDNFTYSFVLKACAAAFRALDDGGADSEHWRALLAAKGFELHASIFKSGFCYDHFIHNLLIHMYAQCGSVRFARKVFDEMVDRNVHTWNIMISACDQAGDFDSSDQLFNSMPARNVVSWNTLLARYVRLCDVEAAERVLDEMPIRDSVSWNTIIALYVHTKDYDRALGLFREMQAAGVDPTEVTMISILGACAETGALEVGREIHQTLRLKQSRIEGYLGNALVDMYAKCGEMSSARRVFNELKMKHIACWNAMIVGLAVHGYSEEALKLFAAMDTSPHEATPNRITFMGVLTACSHKGLVEEGRGFFRRMTSEYSIRPDFKHYGCMVDLLSRSGQLSEAFHLIQEASLDTKAPLWRTLLGSCRIHSNVELADECFNQLSGCLTDGDYVLLSNIYAEAERWDDVQRVRNAMIDSKVAKQSGYSNFQPANAG